MKKYSFKYIIKKSFFTLMMIICVTSTVYILNYIINSKLSNYTIEYVSFLYKEEKRTLSVCTFDENNDYFLTEVEIERYNNKNQYEMVFDLYNINKNTLPANKLIVSAPLMYAKEFVLLEDTLIIKLDDVVLTSEVIKIFNAMKVTYVSLGIKHLEIQIGDTTYSF